MEVHCKVLESKDSLQYRALRLESLRLHPECFGSDYEAQNKMPKLYFESLIESGTQESVMIGAFVDEVLVGLCGLTPTEENSLEIIQMYVSSMFRGQAIGAKMLQKAKSIFESRPEKEIVLSVYVTNTAAIKVYEKFGFEHVKKNENEIIMTLSHEHTNV